MKSNLQTAQTSFMVSTGSGVISIFFNINKITTILFYLSILSYITILYYKKQLQDTTQFEVLKNKIEMRKRKWN